MTSYRVVVTRVGATVVLRSGVEKTSLVLHKELSFWSGVVCAVPEAIAVEKEEQNACQASAGLGQSSPQGICHEVGSARKTRRSARTAMEASHRERR